MKNKQEKEKFPYRLRLHDLENNDNFTAYFTQKGAELWDAFARRGYVGLVWDEHSSMGGYYYKLSEIKRAMQDFWNEGLIKKGGYYYEERYYY